MGFDRKLDREGRGSRTGLSEGEHMRQDKPKVREPVGPVRRRPTMKDVAKRAGVSLSTVSYVLNGTGPVAAERRERILKACKELDYTQNDAARRLRSHVVSTIGLVVPDLANQYFAFVAEGVERAASERDVLVVLCAPEAEGIKDSVNARLLRSQRLDGVVYLAGNRSAVQPLLDLTKVGPVVLVDEQIPGFDLPSVVADNRRGAREVAEEVIAAGHRRVGIVGGPTGLWTARERLAGYRQALRAAGLDPKTVPVLTGDYRQESGMAIAEDLLTRPLSRRPTALLCANDLMAIGALEFCRGAGLAVPGEVSIVGFDDLPVSSVVQPRLTTVRQPARDMGYRAAEMLLDLIEGLGSGDRELFPVTLQRRESVGPPPKRGGR